MDIFFVRHGETEYNHRHLHQPADSRLDATGRRQAQVVAEKLVAYQPTHVITSVLARARETAEAIAEKTQLPITESLLLVELERPTRVIGYHHFGLRSLYYMVRWFISLRVSGVTPEAGETRRALIERVVHARKYLESFPDDARVVVVSHSVFISFFTEHICNDRPISLWRAALLLLKIKKLDNTSITHVVVDQDAAAGVCKWQVRKFDDDTHLHT